MSRLPISTSGLHGRLLNMQRQEVQRTHQHKDPTNHDLRAILFNHGVLPQSVDFHVAVLRCRQKSCPAVDNGQVLVSPALYQQRDNFEMAGLRHRIKAVTPSLLAKLLPALDSSSRRTTSRWPFSDAARRAVQPPFVAMSLSAPVSSSRRTTSRWPFADATRRAVQPIVVKSWSAPVSTSRRTTSRWPL